MQASSDSSASPWGAPDGWGRLTLDAILEHEAADVLAWLKSVRTRLWAVPREFNWLGLAEASAANARQQATKVSVPIDRLSEEQQAVLRDALCSDRVPARPIGLAASEWLIPAVPALTWAQTALTVYTLLARRAKSSDQQAYLDSAMTLRAYLISRLGAVPGDRVLDVDDVLYWFFDPLRITPEQAYQRALACRRRMESGTLTPRVATELRQLRRLKNRLAPLVFLIESGQLDPLETLQAWLDIQEALP